MIKLYETARNAAGASSYCQTLSCKAALEEISLRAKGARELARGEADAPCEATRPTKYELSQSRVSATRRSRAQQLGLSGVAPSKAGRFK